MSAALPFCAAQMLAIEGDFGRSLARHLELARQAALAGARLVLFPELSLTGYTRDLDSARIFTLEDARLAPLQGCADELGLAIVCGAPLSLGSRLLIASFLFQPGQSPSAYAKKFLHPGEETAFAASPGLDPVLEVGGERLASAICYDIEHDAHVAAALALGPTIYAAGIFYSATGIDGGLARLRSISARTGMAALMSNYVGDCWNLKAGGKSAILDSRAGFEVLAPPDRECLVLAGRQSGNWAGRVIML